MTEQFLTIYEAKIAINDTMTTLARINDIAKETASTIVVFDAKKIAGPNHIRSAIRNASRSFACGKPIARTLAMEILLCASGQRQCSLAPRFGLHEGENVLFVVIIEGDAERAQELLNKIVIPKTHGMTASRATLMEEFGITEDELSVVGDERIEELVIERIALMNVYK
ncbi:MAG: KEOPS complex subunit Cgi121 [Methanocalculaceae archaeon]|nr:KEOPS complex subunit Cgi121 [Methanocalculaceae archaeon]